MELPANRKPRRPRRNRNPCRPAPESAPGRGAARRERSLRRGSLDPARRSRRRASGCFNFTAGPDSGVFLCGGVRVNGGSVYRYSDQVAVGSSWETPFHLQKLEPEPADEIGERLSDFDVLILELEDDTKYTYTFYTEGLEVAKSLPAADAGEPVRYRVDPKAYAELIGLERVRMGEGLWFPSWLRVIRKSRVTGIAFRSSDGESETVYLPDDERFDWALSGLDISVRPGSAERVGREEPSRGGRADRHRLCHRHPLPRRGERNRPAGRGERHGPRAALPAQARGHDAAGAGRHRGGKDAPADRQAGRLPLSRAADGRVGEGRLPRELQRDDPRLPGRLGGHRPSGRRPRGQGGREELPLPLLGGEHAGRLGLFRGILRGWRGHRTVSARKARPSGPERR